MELFNNIFNNILDGQCPFFHWNFLPFHPLCDFIAVTTQFYYFFFNGRIYFNLVLCGCANVSTYVCRYASMWVMFVLPTLHNPLKGMIMICSKDIFQKHFNMMGKNGQTPVILTIYIFFQRSSSYTTGSFRFLPNSVQG